MKKWWGILCLTLALLVSLAAAETTELAAGEYNPYQHTVTIHQAGDYEYILLKDRTAEIVSYTGSDEELVIPEELNGVAVTSIGEWAFAYCDGLTSVEIPEGVTSIGEWAFAYCDGLTSVEIPASVTEMTGNPFVYCSNLTEIKVSADNPVFIDVDGVLFNDVEKTLVCYPISFSATDYTIPQGTLSIGNYAFSDCDALTSVEIPSSVTSIGAAAFCGCDALTSVEISEGVTSIGAGAFDNCDALTSVTIPSSVTSIGEDAFRWCDALTLSVVLNSFAEQYALENDIPYVYQWFCELCQHRNTGNFCTECGASKPVSWVCDCGAHNNTKFCSVCGAKRPQITGWDCDCGAHNDTKFCSDCGAKRPETTDWECDCGATNTSNFCGDCGAERPAPLTCPSCGHQPTTVTVYCTECGAKF